MTRMLAVLAILLLVSCSETEHIYLPCEEDCPPTVVEADLVVFWGCDGLAHFVASGLPPGVLVAVKFGPRGDSLTRSVVLRETGNLYTATVDADRWEFTKASAAVFLEWEKGRQFVWYGGFEQDCDHKPHCRKCDDDD